MTDLTPRHPMIPRRTRLRGGGPLPRSETVLLVAALAVCLGGSPVHAGEHRLLLSWNAPYGSPGASDRLEAACDDTARVDTLYLSFEPGLGLSGLTRMSGTLYFYPLPGDTLGPFWSFKRGWSNTGNMLIDFDQAAGFPCDVPWKTMGYGSVSYDTLAGRGRLELNYMIQRFPIVAAFAGQRYCFARVSIRHRRADLEGCGQPVCVEWARAHVEYAGGKREAEFVRGDRFTTWNSSGSEACLPRRGIPLVQPWRPKPSGARMPSGD